MITEKTRLVLDRVYQERVRQEQLHAGRTCADDIHNGERLAILVEEVGEVAKAGLEAASREELRAELIQVAAVAAAWAEVLS